MIREKKKDFQFCSLNYQRPYEVQDIEQTLLTLAECIPRGDVIFEIHGHGDGTVSYLLGAEKNYLGKVKNAFSTFIKAEYRKMPSRNTDITVARGLKITKPSLSLNTEVVGAMVRSGLSSLSHLHDKNAHAVVQIILSAAYAPTTVSNDVQSPNASFLDIVLGNVSKASSEQVKSMRKKASQYSYDATVRIGASGKYASGTLNALTGVYRTMNSSGVRISSSDISPSDIATIKLPWRPPLRLSISELAAMMLLPYGEETYAGASPLHPKQQLPPAWYKPPNEKENRAFAVSPDGTTLAIKPKDNLEHVIIQGPTGSGKSTSMINLIMKDIEAGRSVMVIDPKADLVTDILARIPPSREDDVIVIDPSDENAVGWNPLDTSLSDPHLTADAILAVFSEIFSENWGIRTADIMSACLLTLINQKNATLMWLIPLLTDENFRKEVIKDCDDRIALKPFWQWFDSLKDSERRTIIEPTLNKMRQIIFRPGLRNIFGQPSPKFKLKDLFLSRKIVLVPLNKGLVGTESAKLLGSLLVGLTWTESLSRARIPPEKRHIINLYIDELQDYIALNTSFADMLAQARGLGLSITAAHQYRSQLNSDLRDGVDTNCRNKIIFGLSAGDAANVAAQAPNLDTIDFMSLPRYHIYTSFMVDGRSTGFISGTTLPPPEATRLPAEVKAISQTKYGRSGKEVEAEILATIYKTPVKEDPTVELDVAQNRNTIAQQLKELREDKSKPISSVGLQKEVDDDNS